MPRRSDLRLAAVVLGAALLLTGCASTASAGGSPAKPAASPEPVPSPTHMDLDRWDPQTSGNGLMLLDGPGARASMLAAMRAASPATMTGTFTGADGRVLSIAVTGSRTETVAEFTADDVVTVVAVSEGQAYMGPSADALTCIAADDPELTRWGSLLRPDRAVAEFTEDAAALGAPKDGVVDLLLGAEGTLGTLGVQSEGPALPVSLTRADAAGTLLLSFSGWGEDIALPDIASAAGC